MPPYAQYYNNQFTGQPPHTLWSPNAYGYDPSDGRRSKSPSSLINHTGLSPVPLSTPPRSRNPSQAPDQPPDQMIYDDGSGSNSDSPTSIRTPDDQFDVDMDMLDSDTLPPFYPHSNGGMVTSQMDQGALAAMDSNAIFPDQVLHEVLNATVAEQNFNMHFGAHSQHQQQHMIPDQPYNQIYSQGYTSQPLQQDPWTSQRPPHNPNIPRSGVAMFDPASDTTDLSEFVNFDVSNWTNNHTDPNYLLSPNDPIMPPRKMMYLATQNHLHAQNQAQVHSYNHGHTHSPVDMTLVAPSPSPDSSNFVNYNHSSELFNNYITPHDSQLAPSSPGTSTTGSSMQLTRSPYPAAASPLSASSPVGAESILSYRNGPPVVMAESYYNEQLEAKPAPPPSPIEVDASPTGTIPEMSFNASPEPASPDNAQSAAKGGIRPGGRALGTHLEPKVAKAAHDMRKTVACWHCVLQRDKCGPGDTCERCLKRAQRANADCGLGCTRIKLVELSVYFLPSLVAHIHEDTHLTQFVSQYVRQWGNVELTVYMTCGQHTMPRIPVKVYEFLPNGKDLLVQIQYRTDPETGKRIAYKKQSPPLGMVHINHNEEKKYDQYISDIVDNHLDAFGELCWMEDDNDFPQKLFKLMTRVKPKGEEETKLLREVFRLVVATFIMSHTLTLSTESLHAILPKLHSYNPATGPAPSTFTSPRMTNRQLKYFFSRLQRSILSTLLNKLQQIFKSSKGSDRWLIAFVAVLGLCMASEDQQKTLHITMETKARTSPNLDPRDAQTQAEHACREIDSRVAFISHIFRLKYNRKFNPLRDAERSWEREVGFKGEEGRESVNFVKGVAGLVRENLDYLENRKLVSISAANQTAYTSRLVGHFLLSFWLPSV